MTLTAVKQNDQLNPDNLLGYLEFHALPDLQIRKDDLATLWKKHGLPHEFLPGEIRPCDAFRRATTAAQGEVQANWNGGSQYNARLLVREVKSDAGEIVRLLVREIVDSKNEVLDYGTAGKITFMRNSGTVKTECTWGLLSEYGYDGVLRKMSDTYNDFTAFHSRDTVRNLTTRVLRSTNPVSIVSHSSGKFVPKRSKAMLSNLKGLPQDLRKYAKEQDCGMEILPIIDTKDQRELVARRASIELTGELDEVMSDFADYLKKNEGLEMDAAQRLIGKAVDIQERALEYEKLVSVRLGVLRSQLERFMCQITVNASYSKTVV
jgi:hypothetical protein